MDNVGVIAGVSGRQLAGNKIIYDVQANLDGVGGVTLSTFDAPIAKSARDFAASGQRVSVRWEQKPAKDPKYPPNNYLNEIAPEGQLGQAGVTGGAEVVDGIEIKQAGNKGGRGGGGGMSQEDKVRVSKLSCQNTATAAVFQLYQGLGPELLEEAKAHAKAYARELYAEAWGQAVVSPAQTVAAQQDAAAEGAQIVPTATSPAEVAAAVPGVVVGAQTDQAASAADLAWN